jgi:hypothetical protein
VHHAVADSTTMLDPNALLVWFACMPPSGVCSTAAWGVRASCWCRSGRVPGSRLRAAWWSSSRTAGRRGVFLESSDAGDRSRALVGQELL